MEKKGDFLIIALVVVLFAILCALVFARAPGSETGVLITSPGKKYFYPLSQDRVVSVKGRLGESLVSIKDSKVSFLDSPCPNKLCMKGSASRPGEFLACLPNGVAVSITSAKKEGEVDAVSY